MKNQNSKCRRYQYKFEEEKNMRNKNMDHRTITIDTREEGKMERMMKTGVIAAGTVAAAGLAFGMNTVVAQAEEMDTGTSEYSVQVSSETAVPETVDEARKAVDAAQSDVEKTDATVKEAQNKVDDAQTAVKDASAAAETARNEAEQAFEDAKSEAASADASAGSDVETAERNADEAESRVQQAEDEAASAEETLREAESSVQEAVSESPVTESDITDKEAELADAETNINQAETTLEEAEGTRKEAADEVNRKEAEKNDAEKAVKEAEADKAEADAAASSAQDAASRAEQELQSAEDLKNGTLDIGNTVQYKEKQEAKDKMDKASVNAETAAEETDQANEDLENAESAVGAAEKELDSAVADRKEREAALSEAENTKNAAENAREEAQKTYDSAVAGAAGADAAVSEAENAVADAKEGVKRAEEARNAADKAVESAVAAVDTARQDAENAVKADIAAAEKEAVEKQSKAEAAQEALNSAEEKYKEGTLGLIDWVLAKDGLSKDQLQDLTFAREVLINASKEDFSKWAGGENTGLPEERKGKVVVIGDEKDATNLENLLKSFEIMKKINELRATDNNFTGDLQRNAAYTNFYFMATAEAGAMRGAGLMRHSSLTTSCEDLAFGYSDPTVGWYNQEKVIFDRIKGELGITEITSMKDVARIEKEADQQGVVVGHYTNLLWAADQVMGVGYTQYRGTSCYNASKASNYTNDRYNRAMHLYTIEEFEQLVQEYYQSVNKTACEAALGAAAAEQSEAESRLQALLGNKDTAVETAVQGVMAELSARKVDAEKAAQSLDSAKQVLADAEKSLADAGTKKATADEALQSAQEALNQAAAQSSAADTAFAYAEKARDDAGQAVTEAETALKDAMSARTSAAAVLEEKRAALAKANNALNDASAVYADAEKKLAALTSDETLEALKERKRLADADLQSALENQTAKEVALKQAAAVRAQAEIAVMNAQTALKEAQDRLSEAILERDSGKERVRIAKEELESLRDQYAPVLRAVAARDAARENLNLAKSALQDARAELVQAQEDMAQAQLAKTITADRLLRASGLSVEEALKADIEDPEFAYLNAYVSAVKAADADIEKAGTLLEAANSELDARKVENEKAQKAYIAAVADLVIAQDRVGMFQAEPVTNPELKPSAETVIHKKSTVPAACEKGMGSAVLDVSEDTPKTVLTKAESTGRVYSTEPIATGDNANVMALLAEILAGAGLMAVVFKMRRREEGDSIQQ